MFKVRNKYSNEVLTVYATTAEKLFFDEPIALFLIYKEGKWKWVNSESYIPVEEEKENGK